MYLFTNENDHKNNLLKTKTKFKKPKIKSKIVIHLDKKLLDFVFLR